MGLLTMARKNALEGLMPKVAEQGDSPGMATTERRPIFRGVGLAGQVSESFKNIQADLKDAREKIEAGELVVEIETDLIDPSFVSDRMPDDSDMADFVQSVREHGQRTPILVRPHPDNPSRYQIAFGHRRFRAAQALGRPVKALVRPLSDAELVVAQGQENQERLDLSFIERAMFATRLEEKGFSRDVICAALSIDKSGVSRMISVVATVPNELILAIGSARSTGRRKWMDLAALLETINWKDCSERLLAAARDTEAPSENKLEAVFRAATSASKPAAQASPSTKTTSAGVKLDRKPGLIRIRFDESTVPNAVVENCLARVREVFAEFGVKI